MANNQPLWDPPLASAASMAENCMKLGAVILKPPKPEVGFTHPPNEGNK